MHRIHCQNTLDVETFPRRKSGLTPINELLGSKWRSLLFLLTHLFYSSWVFRSVRDRGFAPAGATIQGASESRGGDDTGHVPLLGTAPCIKNGRRGNVFCRGQTFPRHPVFWIFRLTNVMPDVETFHEHPHGETFPPRAVFPKTFPRQAFPLDVETFLIGAKRHVRKSCRRGNVFPDIANVSTSPSF